MRAGGGRRRDLPVSVPRRLQPGPQAPRHRFPGRSAPRSAVSGRWSCPEQASGGRDDRNRGVEVLGQIAGGDADVPPAGAPFGEFVRAELVELFAEGRHGKKIIQFGKAGTENLRNAELGVRSAELNRASSRRHPSPLNSGANASKRREVWGTW